MVDMAHIAGLVATGAHPNPLPYADVVTTTTHKTLTRGPRGGMILTNDEALAKKINSAIFPGTQGGPLEHVIAAKAVAFKEALDPEFTTYIEQVIKNTQAMAEEFAKVEGLRLIAGGSDNHLLNLKVLDLGINGKEAQDLLDSVHITLNKEAILMKHYHHLKLQGCELEPAAITSRGFKEVEAKKVAQLVSEALVNHDNQEKLAEVRKAALELTRQFPL